MTPSNGTFNLLRKMAADIPNGVGISSIPNGSEFGDSQGIQLSDGGEDQQGQQKTPLREIIGDILHAAATNKPPEEIALIAKKAMNAELPQELIGNDDAFKMVVALGRRAGEDQSSPATNPDTGEKEHTLDQLASQIAAGAGWEPTELIEEAEERSSMSNEMTSPNMLQSSTRTAAKTEVQDPLKKRKRGNPFKVLMGKVQKMLDHGMGKKEIVSKMKSQGSWDPETVARCVDIVKEYNRRNKRKEKSESQKESKSFNLMRSMSRTAAERPGFEYPEKSERESIYDIQSDPKMQSTMELLTRMMYLNGSSDFNIELSNENRGGIGHEVDKQKAKKQLDAVMSELRRRQYTDEDLSPLVDVASGGSKKGV